MFGRATKNPKYPKRVIQGVDYVRIKNPRYKYKIVKEISMRHTMLSPYDFENDYLKCKEGTLTIKVGYHTDGPSGPTIDTGSFMRGAFFHDALYQAIRTCLMPKWEKRASDRVLRQMCLEDGMWWIRAWWVHRGVQKYGHASCEPENCEYKAK